MAVIDIEKLLEEVSRENPCGEDLEYDWAFLELDRKMQVGPEQVIGDSIVSGEPPNWGEVRDNAISLLTRSKDLRLAVRLTQALLNINGLDGMLNGLSLIEQLLEQYWSCLYPQLDPEDDNDPTIRLNVLAALCDHETVVRDLRDSVIVDSRTFGRWTFRDIEFAQGKFASSADADRPPVQMADIDAAFLDTDLVELESKFAIAKSCLEHLQSIESLYTIRSETYHYYTVNLDVLRDVLIEVQQLISEQLAKRSGDEIPSGYSKPPREQTLETAEVTGSEISSREDILRLLGGACNYMSHNEPSHPAGQLLQKAMRLLSNDLIDTVKDIAPDAISQIETIRGLDAKDPK